jgi:Zn-dependent protease
MLNSTDRLEIIARLRMAVEDYMAVFDYAFRDERKEHEGLDGMPHAIETGQAKLARQGAGTIRLYGKLKVAPELAYRPIRHKLERLGYTPYLNQCPPDKQRPNEISHELVVVPGVIPKVPQNVAINLALFIATVVSVMLSGSGMGDEPGWLSGLLFAGSLLTILVAHEAGHYVVGRLRGAPVSLPYFIPFPLNFFGTMGAVIVQREPFEDRRAMLEIGIAGPLAGFMVALPLYMFGVTVSDVKELAPFITQGLPLTGFGDSLLTHFIKVLQFGWFQPGYDIFEHPIALGAWIGLLITGINLIPAGQLDGGHIAAAIFGNKAKYLSYASIAAMLAMSFVSTNWLLWAALLLLFGRTHPPAFNNATKLDTLHYGLGLIAVLLLVLVFVPLPIYVW